MATNWFCRIAGRDYGPYGVEQLLAFAREGRLSPIDFVRDSIDGIWLPAAQLPWLAFPASVHGRHPVPPLPASVQTPSTPVSATQSAWPVVLVVMTAFVGLCGLLFAVSVAITARDHAGADGAQPAANAQPASQIARLAVSGQDATNELQALFLELSDEQKTLLGLAVLSTGIDIYAADITIANTGNVAVQVYPQNLTVHYGDETASIITSDHARFLHACVLQPGEVTRGWVMYKARIDIGAAMRQGAGGLSYNDPTLEVELPGEK